MKIIHSSNFFLRYLTTPNLDGLEIQGNQSINLIILNSPSLNFNIIANLWQHCRYKVCADGAANRLFDSSLNLTGGCKKFIPDYVIGDLDSARSEVVDYYRYLSTFTYVGELC